VTQGESQQDWTMEVSLQIVIGMSIATFLLAGLVKGVIGLGLPSISIGLLALIMTPAEAAAIMIFPTFVTNVWQMLVGPYLVALLRRLWTLMVGSVIGIWLGGGILTSSNSRLAACGLGLALVVYAVIGLTKVKFSVPQRHEIWLSPLIGLVTGVIAGGTGVFVIPAGPYYHAIRLNKDELVQMLGLSFTISVVALALILWRDGVMQLGNATGSALAVIPALVGMAIGQRVRQRASEETFRQYFFGGLLALGAQQAIRNMF
jgi:uncharacterized membrane protein YfcA